MKKLNCSILLFFILVSFCNGSTDLTRFSFSLEMDEQETPRLSLEATLSDNFSNASSIGVLYWLVDNDQTWVYPERGADGTFRLDKQLNRYLSSGNYVVRAVSAIDNSGEELYLNESQLVEIGYNVSTFFYNPQADIVRPMVDSFSMTPFSYNPSSEQWQFTYDISASDDLSGLQNGHIVELVNGSGTSLQEWAYFDDQGTATVTRGFEKFIPSDIYTVNTIRIYDNAGNDGWLYTEDLQALGWDYQLELDNNIEADNDKPVLLSFALMPGGKSQTNRPMVNVDYYAEDNGSGFDRSYLRAKDEFGNLHDHWIYPDENGSQIFSFSLSTDFTGLLKWISLRSMIRQIMRKSTASMIWIPLGL